ncbi:transporter family protein [Chitinophaga cymbidii]|nr:transporter [Chitinophaga cymbidii]
MMKRISILVLLTTLTLSTFACDICGCGVGSYYIGILPEFSKKIAGIRYRYNTLRTHIGAGGAITYLTTEETYRTAEVWGGWTIGTRFRVMGYVPVSFNEKLNQGITTRRNGLGDAGIQGFYQLFDNRRTVGRKLLVHSLWLGGGVKLPTGRYDAAEKNTGTESANIFQLGSGSVDFTFNGMYDIRLQDAGINMAASYKVNTRNGEDYRYGNKFSANAQAYYKFRIRDFVTIAPNAGVMYERAGEDDDDGFSVDVSGGYALLGTFGAEVTFSRIAVGANFQAPMSQDLAGGFVKANNRAMAHISYIL